MPEKDKKFNKELTAFLNERFIDDDDSAADKYNSCSHIQQITRKSFTLDVTERYSGAYGECFAACRTVGATQKRR